jgi:hypothetical protein
MCYCFYLACVSSAYTCQTVGCPSCADTRMGGINHPGILALVMYGLDAEQCGIQSGGFPMP